MTAADEKKWMTRLFLITAAGLVLRILPAYLFYGTFDVHAWEQYSTYWPDKISPYDDTGRYPYSPVWFWIISLCAAAARALHLPFSFVIKWPLMAADLGILWLLAVGLRRSGEHPRTALWAGTAYFLNPVSILISGYHGQFDNISLFFSLLAWQTYVFQSQAKRVWSALWLSIAVAVKHFNILLIPLFFFSEKARFRKALFLCGPPALFLSLILPHCLLSGAEVFRVFGYNLGAGYWGWSGVGCRIVLFLTGNDWTAAPWFQLLDYFNPLLYLAMFALSYWMIKKYDLLDAILVTLLIFYVFTTQMAPQYTLWILPFAAVRRGPFFYLYSIVGFAQLGVFYYCHYHWFYKLPFIGQTAMMMPPFFVVLRHLTWLVCVLWLLGKLWEMKRRSGAVVQGAAA